jgi:hypothetical protein
MALVPFSNEEQVTVGEDVLTLVLDFRAIDVIEGLIGRPMPLVVANLRSGQPHLSWAGKVVWALLRDRHEGVTLDQAAGLMFGEYAEKVGFVLDALLERAFPQPTEDKKKPSRPPKRRGALKPS